MQRHSMKLGAPAEAACRWRVEARPPRGGACCLATNLRRAGASIAALLQATGENRLKALPRDLGSLGKSKR